MVTQTKETKILCDGAICQKIKEQSQLLTCHLISNASAEEQLIKQHKKKTTVNTTLQKKKKKDQDNSPETKLTEDYDLTDRELK